MCDEDSEGEAVIVNDVVFVGDIDVVVDLLALGDGEGDGVADGEYSPTAYTP